MVWCYGAWYGVMAHGMVLWCMVWWRNHTVRDFWKTQQVMGSYPKPDGVSEMNVLGQ